MSDETICSELPLKNPTTFEEQIELLQSRGMLIANKELALKIISNVNYYRFSAYLLPFRDRSTGCYKEGTTFNKIYNIYEFDRKLRSILMSAIEPIEVILKTKISYFHAHSYGAEGYKECANFLNSDRHEKFIRTFNESINKNKKAPFVSHHILNYKGNFPIWVAVEIFSFGMLSVFFANMKPETKKQIAKNIFDTGPEHLESWLFAVTYLRNRCAHYMRLYFHRIVVFPRMPSDYAMLKSNRIFDIIYVMKYLYLDQDKWNHSFVRQLEALIKEYEEDIRLEYIGFPSDWLVLLESNNFPKDRT